MAFFFLLYSFNVIIIFTLLFIKRIKTLWSLLIVYKCNFNYKEYKSNVYILGKGFHGLHVMIGTVFLAVGLCCVLAYHLTDNHHLGCSLIIFSYYILMMRLSSVNHLK